MNTNTTVIGGIVVVLLLVGGVFLYTQSNPSMTATSTPTGITTQSGDLLSSQTPGIPTATTNTTVNPSDTAAIVMGEVLPDGAFTTYWYEYGASANLGLTTANQNIGSGYTELTAPAYITGLAKDTTYYFRLVAQNQFGKSTGSTYTFHTTVGTPSPVGTAPTTKTLGATGVSRTTASLSGEVTPNQSSTEYWFEYGETANLGNASALQSVGNGTATVPASLSLSNLAPATTYYFRIDAQNQFGTVTGSILTFTTLGPPVSVAPVVTTQLPSPFATTTATLQGTVNPYGTQTTYWFEYSTDSLFGSVLLKTTPQKSAGAGRSTVSVEANISALHPLTTYYYRTVAQNSAGTVRGQSVSFETN